MSDQHNHHGHSHGQDHGHAHGHSHSHVPANFTTAFAVGIALNFGFIVIEVVYGLLSNSLALLADAGHNLSDVLGLALAWVASVLVRRLPTPKYTYGLKGSSILASLANATFLLISVGAIAWEAVGRFRHPEPVATGTVIIVAAIGILINGITAWLFASGQKHDINLRAAFLHMAGDALLSLGVVIAGFAMQWTHWTWLDPLVSLLLVAFIVYSTWGLLRESLDLALNAVPSGVDIAAVEAYLAALPGIAEVHDLHIWGMSTTESALTVHLVQGGNKLDSELLERICHELHDKFGIEHPTIQFEDASAGHACKLAPDHVV